MAEGGSTWLLLRAVLRRDLTAALRRRAEVANPLLFFIIVCSLFPLGLGPDPELLATLAPGILWVVALLSCLMAADNLFRSDFEDATLEQMVLSPASLYLQVLAKTFGHWLLTGFPLTLLSPVLAVMLQLPAAGIGALLISLALGTAVLSFIGAIGAGLTVGLRRGGLLLSLIVLPLYVPVLIFGSSAVYAALAGYTWGVQIAVLGALLALALALAPLAIAGGLRISLDQ